MSLSPYKDVKILDLVEFYNSFWGKLIYAHIPIFAEPKAASSSPLLGLGFTLPWKCKNAIHAIPHVYGGQVIAPPAGDFAQTIFVDPRALPFDNSSLHFIWSIHLMGCTDDNWIREIERVLCSGGKAYIFVANRRNPFTKNWPMGRLRKKDIIKHFDKFDWHIAVKNLIGWPAMMFCVELTKLPRYGVTRISGGSMGLVGSSR